MNDKQFDDFIKNRLENHGSSVPSNMWERIAANDKKRRGGFFWRLLSVILLLLIVGVTKIFYFPNINKPVFTKKENIVKTNNAITSVAKNDVAKSTDRKETVTREKIKPDTNNNFSSTAIIKENGSEGTIKSRLVFSKNIHRLRSNHHSLPQKKKKTSVANQQSFFALSDKQQNNKQTNVSMSSNPETISSDSTVAKQNKKEDTKAMDSAANSTNDVYEGQGDKFYLELYAGPAMPINQITASTKAYEQLLKEGSSSRLSFSVGARFKYEFSKRVSAKIGLQYTQINEKMVADDSAAAYRFSSVNHYKNVGVPLLISYKTALLPNIPVSVNAGIILNISSRTKGLIPAVSGQPIDIRADNVYSRNATVQLYLSLDASKPVGNRSEIFAEPWFSYQTKSIVNRMYAFNQKLHGVGLVFGFRYCLFKIDNR